MLNLPNPPQPVSLPIRNAVNHEDRIALLLNKAGSSSDNPISGTSYTSFSADDASTISTTKGVALRVKFGVADASETITSAVVNSVDSNGDQTSFKDIKSKFVKTSTEFYADLFAGSGEDLPSGSSSQRAFVDISTNLGRRIRQQCYIRNTASNTVLLNGAATSSTAPVNYIKADTATEQTFTIPTSFFASWNDEIGRQHDADNVALKNPIIKPYGGAETVEVYGLIGDSRSTQYAAETPIKDVSSIQITSPVGQDDVTHTLIFYFRSKTGSDNTIAVKAYVRIFTCGTSGTGSTTSAPTITTVSISGSKYRILVNSSGNMSKGNVIARRYDPGEGTGTLSSEVTTSNVSIADITAVDVTNSLASGVPSGSSLHVVTLSTTAGEDTFTFIHTT